MGTILFASPIFGPLRSRRLGLSLGINLLPADGKLCNFDCLYCEIGLNADRRPEEKLPSAQTVLQALEAKLIAMREAGELPNSLTFAGNGEPTLNPAFPEVVEGVLALRDTYAPEALISVLTNATTLIKPKVFEALLKVDRALLKFDTVNTDFIRAVDQPQTRYDVEALIERAAAMKGRCWVQTLFMRGHHEGKNLDNTTNAFVEPWLAALKRIQPEGVAIYTLDRESPVTGLEKADRATLEAIAEQVRALGLDVMVSG